MAVYYRKRSEESQGSGLPGPVLLTVYQGAFCQLRYALPTGTSFVRVVYDTFQYAQRLQPSLEADEHTWGPGDVRWGDSLQDKPLQLADLVAGTVRRYLANQPNEGRFQRLVPVLWYFEPWGT